MSNKIEPRLYFHYAEIDPETKMCIGIHNSSHEVTELGENFVEIPVEDPDYLFKYYIDGNWYEDAEGTIPWTSSLI